MPVSTQNEVVRLKHNLEAAGMAKKGRPPKFSASQFYPRALENDLQDALRAELTRINAELTQVALIGINDSVADDMGDLNAAPVTLSEGFITRSRQIGERIAENSASTFSKQIDMIIGRPYYPPGLQGEILDNWHAEFQTLCISAGQDGKKAIAATVAIAKEQGWNRKQLEAQIAKILPPETKHRAELIARTETGKLNSRCNIATYQECGVKYYKWLTTMDGRERETHAELNGVICSVDNPEVYFTENPDNPLRPVQHDRTGKMYHGHPGTDFQCRCSMIMWDPEIDGQFEVKEDQRREEQQRLEQEEKEAQERAEAEAKAKAEAEEQKRQERLERAKRKAEEAEARRKEAERKAEILRKANERHARRTPEQAERIRQKWAARHGEFNFIKANPDFNKLNTIKACSDYIEKTYNITVDEGFKNCDPLKVKDALRGIDAFKRVFPGVELKSVKKVTGKGYIMAAEVGVYLDGTETPYKINMCYTYLKKKDAPSIAAPSLHRNASAYSSAAHEMGHILNYWIAKKTKGSSKHYETLAKAWVWETAEQMAGKSLTFQEVMDGYRAKISIYSDHYSKYTETIAEAMADVFQNKENAQEFSKALFKRVQKEYKTAAKL